MNDATMSEVFKFAEGKIIDREVFGHHLGSKVVVFTDGTAVIAVSGDSCKGEDPNFYTVDKWEGA